jgi:hypothetical protein
VFHDRGERADMYRQYLQPVLGRSNLTVLTNAKTLNVVLEGKTARGVHYVIGGPDGEQREGTLEYWLSPLQTLVATGVCGELARANLCLPRKFASTSTCLFTECRTEIQKSARSHLSVWLDAFLTAWHIARVSPSDMCGGEREGLISKLLNRNASPLICHASRLRRRKR